MFRRRSEQPPPSEEASFTPDALSVLAAARDEALALNHHYVGTEHLLLGLMRDPNTPAAQVLAAYTDLESVRAQIQEVIGLGHSAPIGDIPTTPRAQQVLHLARREADQYHAERVSPEHLLIGIFREGEGIAMRVLLTLGVDPGRVIAAIHPRWRHDVD
jgi:ATP-dependent Clp protease ATP-binding subunit ClpC